MLVEDDNRFVSVAILVLAVILILVGVLNGLFMLVKPESWYYTIPGVVRTGMFNQHFVRDIGLIYLFIGMAYAVGLFQPAVRVELWGAPSLWLTGHAIFHFWEVAAGLCAPSVIVTDFPDVTLPALIGLAITAWAWRSRSRTPAAA